MEPFYARYMYHPIAAARRVDSQEELDSLGAEWATSPDAALLALREREGALTNDDGTVPPVQPVPVPVEVVPPDIAPDAVKEMIDALLPGTVTK